MNDDKVITSKLPLYSLVNKINNQITGQSLTQEMINGYDQGQIEEWRAGLYAYQKQKRTKKPFGKDPQTYHKNIIRSSQIQEKQRQFDPILQKYQNPNIQLQTQHKQSHSKSLSLSNHLKHHKQSSSQYDIINLYPSASSSFNPEQQQQQYSKVHNRNNPIRNLYNIINNQKIPDQFYRNRQVKVDDKQSKRKIYEDKLKRPEFDFVKAQYLDSEERAREERKKEEEQIRDKLNKSRQFDNIFQRYYDPEKEDQYQRTLHRSQLLHGQNYQSHLPPSYRSREPFLPSFDAQNPPQSLKPIIQRQQQHLKRHQLRHAIEQEYKRRNDEDFQKQQQNIKNRVHEGKILEQMQKQYNIINNRLHQINRANMYEKKLKENPYSYEFLKRDNKQRHSQGSRQMMNMDWRNNQNWETNSQAHSFRSKSSVNRSEPQRQSIKSGGFC